MDRYIKPVTKEDREFMQRLYRRAAKPKEQILIICELFPSYSKEQIMRTLGLEREKKVPKMKKEYNKMKKIIRSYDEETKAAAVRAVLVYGERNTDVAERYGVSTGTLGGWLKKARDKQLDYMQYADKVEQEMGNEKAAEQDAAPEEEKTFPYSHFIPLAKCEPGVAEQCRAEEQSQPVYEYVDEGSKTAIDEKAIKAAAYDVITIQMAMYPDSSTDTMMRFIQGVQALAEILCGEVE